MMLEILTVIGIFLLIGYYLYWKYPEKYSRKSVAPEDKSASVVAEAVKVDEIKPVATTETSEKEDKSSPIKVILNVLLIITLLGGCYYYNIYSSKSAIKDYASKELVLKGYTVIEISVLDFQARKKNSPPSGTVKFTVKDKNGVLLKGTAAIGESSGGGCGCSKTFVNFSEIKPDNGGVTP